MRIKLLAVSLLALVSQAVRADIVYVTARPSPCTVTTNCPGANTDGTYTEVSFPSLGDYGAVGTAPGHPQTTVARTYISSPEMTDTNAGVDLTPTLGVAGGIYRIDYNFNSVAGNTSTNVVMAVTATTATLSFTETDKFQRQYGSPANQWQTMGYLTNDVGSATPSIQFRYQSGRISGAGAGAAGNRLLFDCWRFTLVEPCLSVAGVSVTGPLGTNVNEVVVAGVTNATAVTVYQNSGSGMVQIGQKTTGVTDGNNTVTVAGLVKGALVAATQTVGGQEGCMPTPTLGTIVGGGANPRIRAVISIRETTDTGPVGAPATDLSSTSIHFLGSSETIGIAPAGGTVINPSTNWQTITFLRGTNEIVGDPVNAAGTTVDGTGYNGFDSVSILVYAYRILPNDIQIFSISPTTSAEVTSNDVFTVNWTWDPVPEADGYRVLRSVNFAGYLESVDVAATNYSDVNVGWTTNTIVTPTTAQSGRSVRWNPSVSNTDNLPGQWGVVDSLNFVIDDLTDTGPHDLYIDNLQNGTTTWQTFEDSAAGTTEVTFRRAGFSGFPGGNVLSAPDSSVVSTLAADNSANSLRLRFQWVGTNNTRWVRLSTSTTIGAVPLVNLDEPISFRILLLPVGSSPAEPPQAISVALINGETVLNWTGTHQLQASSLVTGTYTNVPGVTTAPWTNTFTEPQKFFRLID